MFVSLPADRLLVANMANYENDQTLKTLTGTRDALRASQRSLNEFFEPEQEEMIHKVRFLI